MEKPHIAIRATTTSSVVDLEVVFPGTRDVRRRLAAILGLHGLLCHATYVVKTGQRTIFRAKVSSANSRDIRMHELLSQLDGAYALRQEDSSPRAA